MAQMAQVAQVAQTEHLDEEIQTIATGPEARHDLTSPRFFADPHAVFRRMRAHDPVYWHPALKMWFLVRYDDVQRILRDPRFSTTRPELYMRAIPPDMEAKWKFVNRFLSDMLVFKDGPIHTRSRSLIGKAFTSKAVEALRPFIQQTVDDRIDAIRSHGRMEVIEQLALPLPVSVISKMLGIPEADFPRFKGWTDDFFSLLSSTISGAEIVERAHRGVVGLNEYLRDVLEDRTKHPGDDLLSRLVHAREHGKVLSSDEIVATSAVLLLAGYETTTHLIGNGLLALFEHPDQLHKLRADPELATGAVEEFLRYNSAVFQLVRRAREQVEIDGHVIHEGDLVIGLLHAANRDPARFADADRLDITREDHYHVGFGYGPHICVGAPIARMETRIAINTMLQRLPELALASTSLEWSTNFAIRGVRALPVTFRS
jgi:cytochrome P450